MTCDNPILPFACLAALSCLVALVAAWKRWTHLVLIAAVASAISEFAWATHCVGPNGITEARIMFLLTQALFLGFCLALTQANLGDRWTIGAAVVAGAGPLLAFLRNSNVIDCSRDSGLSTILLSAGGLIALAVVTRRDGNQSILPSVIVAIALALTWKAEWSWYADNFLVVGFDDRSLACSEVNPDDVRNILVVLFFAIFFLFARTPYLCDTKGVSFWIISAIAGPVQFWLVYSTIKWDFYPEWSWLLPIAFALPAASGVCYLARKEHVDLASCDPRLASQGLATLMFVSLAFPVQFERKWVVLGWTLEGLTLIFLFRWIPNRRLPVIGVIVLTAALVRHVFDMSCIGWAAFALAVLVSGIALSAYQRFLSPKPRVQ